MNELEALARALREPGYAHQQRAEAADAIDTLSAKNKALAERVAGLEEGLIEIGRQKLVSEMGNEAYMRADFQGGYESCVRRARTLITGADHAKG